MSFNIIQVVEDFMRMMFYWFCRCLNRRRVTCLAVLAALVVVGVVFAVVLRRSTDSSPPLYKPANDDDYVLTAPDPPDPLPPTPSILGRYKQAAVVSNGLFCAEFGKWVSSVLSILLDWDKFETQKPVCENVFCPRVFS